MNVLQAEKLRDIIAKIKEETGIDPPIESVSDDPKYLKMRVVVEIPREGNLT